MITKRRGLEMKKLEMEVHHVPDIARRKEKLFERSKMIRLSQAKQRQQDANHPPQNYFSQDKRSHYKERDRSQNEEQQKINHKSMYNRPFHMLRQYLHRKQRLSFMPVVTSNPQRSEELSKGFTTLNDFRIKKSKKTIFLNSNSVQNSEVPVQNKISKIDQDFINFNASKNLYQMTYEELQESIKWKKHFLNMLNQKIKDSRLNNIREGLK